MRERPGNQWQCLYVFVQRSTSLISIRDVKAKRSIAVSAFEDRMNIPKRYNMINGLCVCGGTKKILDTPREANVNMRQNDDCSVSSNAS